MVVGIRGALDLLIKRFSDQYVGLDLSQAVARVVMMKFDKLYLKKVGEEGIIMMLVVYH